MKMFNRIPVIVYTLQLQHLDIVYTLQLQHLTSYISSYGPGRGVLVNIKIKSQPLTYFSRVKLAMSPKH